MIPKFTMQDRMKKAREARGLSQTAIADLLGVDRSSIGRWEQGVTPVSKRTLTSWAAVTDVPLYWIEWGTAEAPTPTPGGAEAGAPGLRALRDSNPQPSDPGTRVLSLVSPPPSLDDARRAKESIARRVQPVVSLREAA